ncbi:hypothetical protein SBA4_4530008 [Candidatus Sulfopaludibacter sp. SbA4]|nr:hypothetical protein SBA4_4530008 [Candidatus Sulfopaludibacter sp. SbA4]
MPILPSGIVNQAQLAEDVRRVVAKLDTDEVRSVRYRIGTDSTGEISIFFRIILSDAASQESRLGEVTGRVSRVLFDEVGSYEKWGIYPYFSFRSESEQAWHYDGAWA